MFNNTNINFMNGDCGRVGDGLEFRYDLNKIDKLCWKEPYNSNESIRLAIQNTIGK